MVICPNRCTIVPVKLVVVVDIVRRMIYETLAAEGHSCILSYLATTCIWPSYSETEEDFELPVGSFNAKCSGEMYLMSNLDMAIITTFS